MSHMYSVHAEFQFQTSRLVLNVPCLLAGACLDQDECSNSGTGPVCGISPTTSVMTSQGYQEYPSKDELAPLRNIAIAGASIAFVLFWIWFSWSPYFIFISEYMDQVFCAGYEKGAQAQKLAEKVNKIAGLLKTLYAKAAEVKFTQYLKIFVGFFQVTSSFLTFHIKWLGMFLSAMVWHKATIDFSVLSLPGVMVSCPWNTIS